MTRGGASEKRNDMNKVVGVGSLNIDITGYTPHFPADGETTTGSAIRLGPGGKGNNQMTAAHRAGADAKIIAKVGTDALANIVWDHYKNEGMSTEYIKVARDGMTGAAFIEVSEDTGQNRIIVVKGANAEVTASDVDEAEKDFADAGAVLCQLETGMESVLECKKLALKYGRPFIINPAPYKEIPKSLFDGADFVTPNETEAEYFTGVAVTDPSGAEKAAGKLLMMGAKSVIITLGKNGSFYYDGKTKILLPALSLKAADTTGAGDAFNGGFATAVSCGYDIEDALKFATCTAGLSVTKMGAAVAMPRRDEIIGLFKREYGSDPDAIYNA